MNERFSRFSKQIFSVAERGRRRGRVYMTAPRQSNSFTAPCQGAILDLDETDTSGRQTASRV